MDIQGIVGVLSELLALEQASLAHRVTRSRMFVPRLSLEDSKLVQDMARASEEHAAWLAETILRLGGVPGPRIADARWAHLHYQDIRSVLPHLHADLEALIRQYEAASQHMADEPSAAELVARIRQHHLKELATLRQMLERHAEQTVGDRAHPTPATPPS